MNLLKEIRACSLCHDVLPLTPKPILQFSESSRMLIIGQAPGLAAHETEKPWNDPSGVRLREWLKLDTKLFYDPAHTAIVPMGFCYPGRGKSGDNPPRKECSIRWMDSILCHLKNREVTILIGSYAVFHFLGSKDLTNSVKEYASNAEPYIVLPHPSPRNNIWLAKNKWFEAESLPLIRKKLSAF